MKKFGILALALVFTMMLSVVSFAADPAFKIDTDRDAENYNTEVTTVTPGANSIAVLTKATDGAYYGVLLVKGADVPTVDDDILYIDQVTAKDGSATFNVLPILPDADLAKDLTLYISSNASGEGLITVPVVYGVDAPAYKLGDVNDDGSINGSDVLALVQYVLNGTAFEAALAAADVNVDGATNGSDVLAVIQYVLNGTAF